MFLPNYRLTRRNRLPLSFDGKGRQIVPYFKVDPTWAPKFYFLKPVALNSVNVIR